MPRYKTNLLNIRREIRFQERNRKLISEPTYLECLKTLLAEQRDVLGTVKSDGDRTLALKHCLRITSLLDDRRGFAYYLCEARKCKGFGPTPEERDRALARYMSADHDQDGDFANAREYRCIMELVASD